MIEDTIIDFLEKRLNVSCFFEIQKNYLKEFVIIEKIGSSKKNHLKTVTIAFQSYSDTLYKASVLNEKVKAVVEDLIFLDDIASVSLDNDYNFTDSETKRYRYQAIFDIKHY